MRGTGAEGAAGEFATMSAVQPLRRRVVESGLPENLCDAQAEMSELR